MVEVVCGIVVKKQKVLMAQRSPGMPHPLKWEFPGGKVHPGESLTKALQRELKEELDIAVTVTSVLEPVVWNYPGKQVRLWPCLADLLRGVPVAREHQDLQWYPAGALETLDLLEADRGIVQQLKTLL